MAARKPLRELLREANLTGEKQRRYSGEFLTEKAEIEEALREHWPVKHIWKVLTDAGRITMTYAAFHRHVRQLKTSKEEGMTKTPPESSSKRRTGFIHNPSPNPKDLF